MTYSTNKHLHMHSYKLPTAMFKLNGKLFGLVDKVDSEKEQLGT